MITQLTPLATVKAHFAKADPKILAVLETVDLSEWFEDRPSSNHFYNLVRNIIYQQLAGKAASTIFSRFKDLVGDIRPDISSHSKINHFAIVDSPGPKPNTSKIWQSK